MSLKSNFCIFLHHHVMFLCLSCEGINYCYYQINIFSLTKLEEFVMINTLLYIPILPRKGDNPVRITNVIIPIDHMSDGKPIGS